MVNKIIFLSLIFWSFHVKGQFPQTPFEKSGGNESATYFEAIRLFTKAASLSPDITIRTIGQTDAGYPLHLVLIGHQGQTDPSVWQKQGKVIIMINNAIHPGEPDGIDASLLLIKNIVNGTFKLPSRVCLGIIPVYNIGGALNRGSYSRVNQNGPMEYGFRGNAQYLDLNRDFTKMDSKNARSFVEIFQLLKPDILIDNHVSDGADFQHTLTLLTTQYDKLGGGLGNWLRKSFEPSIYQDMKQKGWDLFPYVNFDGYDLSRGMTQFYDPPRYSSGYAALFQTIGFVPETHMLKPYKERVKSTYDLMVSISTQAQKQADSLKYIRNKMLQSVINQSIFPLKWNPDRTGSSPLTFKGFERDTIISEVTGLNRMYYRHDRPFESSINFYSFFKPEDEIAKPKGYLIPQGWQKVIGNLKINKIPLVRLTKDSTLQLEVYRIESYTAATRPYESHFRLGKIKVNLVTETIHCLKGDYIAFTGHPTDRFLVEMLEPTGEDSYFSWNYFDAILQQKEGYSNYRWEDVAAEWLKKNPEVKAALEKKKQDDPEFAKNSSAILRWVYQQSPYLEPGFMRYPIYRISK